jgi:hypothetical protein
MKHKSEKTGLILIVIFSLVGIVIAGALIKIFGELTGAATLIVSGS